MTSPVSPVSPTASQRVLREPTDKDIEVVMEAEFAAWKQARHRRPLLAFTPQAPEVPVCPHPCEPDGLPDGWQVRWHANAGGSKKGDTEVVVVQRVCGGWTMVLHWEDTAGVARSRQWMHSSTRVTDLYEWLGAGGWSVAAAEQALRDFIASCYDRTDPVEAGEQVLVGLGAGITVFPRSLTGT